ncbi:hypothetical protein PENTCL1PPCAC_11335, partial [Pristionchus entomophagus]
TISLTVSPMMWLLFLLIHWIDSVQSGLPPLIFSVNCGGEEHVDSLGVRFGKDRSTEGESSSWGTRYSFATAYAEDHPLYQLERWSKEDSFSYSVSLPMENSEYSLDLRFSEVFFDRVGAKMFHVLLNGQPLISNLDVLKEAGGRGKPYDTIESFKIQDGNLLFGNVLLDFDGTLEISFSRGPADNPKCNALALFRGPPSSIPRPPRLQPSIQEKIQPVEKIKAAVEEEDDFEDNSSSEKFGSGPRVNDPFANQDPWDSLWPLLVAIPCLMPIVYLLYKWKSDEPNLSR